MLKDAPASELAVAIRRTVAGEPQSADRPPAQALAEGDSPLTIREAEVLAALNVVDLLGHALRRRGTQPTGQLGLQHDDGQAVAQQIVQVSREAQALFRDSQSRHLRAGLTQCRHRCRRLALAAYPCDEPRHPHMTDVIRK